MKIGFFDSGVGGLTVLKEALHLLPHEHYIYYADSDNAPYGSQSKEAVKELTFNAVDFLQKQGIAALVIACNTATSVAIEDLRTAYDFPIIGMEPAVKPAVQWSSDQRVLVFATTLTLKEEKFKQLVLDVDPFNQVDFLPLQELVVMAENFDFDAEVIADYLHNKLQDINWEAYGAVVLGCTHFPYFIPYFKKIIPASAHIMHGNLGTVKHLKSKIKPSSIPFNANIKVHIRPRVDYYISGKLTEASFFERYFRLV